MRIAFLASFLVIGALLQGTPAQGLAFVTRGDAVAGPEPQGSFGPYEIGYLSEPGSPRHWWTRRNLDVVTGDRDGNGRFDDAPARIDAICHAPTLQSGDVVGLLVSFATDFTAMDGTTVRDGDVVRVLGGGAFEALWLESDFEAFTGTTGIDVDAFHLGADGSLFFSFADDETTSDPALIQQNGGEAVLDETTVFEVAPDGTTSIRLLKSEVLALASSAIGAGLSSVVDVTGVTGDPDDAGELWLTFGSANDAIEGKIVSTAAGGLLADIGGTPLDSSSLGFADLEILEGLAYVSASPALLTLHHPADVPSAPGIATFRVAGATPGGTVQLGIAGSVLPAAPVVELAGFADRGFVHLSLADPFLPVSLGLPEFSAGVGPDGIADRSYPTASVPPGLALTVQAWEPATGALAPPVALVHTP